MKALYSQVERIKEVPSRDCVQIVIEVPVHSYKELVNLFHQQKVLLTVAPQPMIDTYHEDYQIIDSFEEGDQVVMMEADGVDEYCYEENLVDASEEANSAGDYDSEPKENDNNWGKYYQRLYKKGFFNSEKILNKFRFKIGEGDKLKQWFYKHHEVESLKEINPVLFCSDCNARDIWNDWLKPEGY